MVDFLKEHPFFAFAILFNLGLWLGAITLILFSTRFRYKWLWGLASLCGPTIFDVQSGDALWNGKIWGIDAHVQFSWGLHLTVVAVFVYWFSAPWLGMTDREAQ